MQHTTTKYTLVKLMTLFNTQNIMETRLAMLY